jgi:hypothetical protein
MRDVDIRQALLVKLRERFRGDKIVNEMGLCMGATRVDVAVINGSLHGYEIKSDSDTLARLPSQVTLYNRVLDYSTIVCGPRYLERITSMVPAWWGITEAVGDSGRCRLVRRRAPRRNPACEPLAIAQLLWRDEAAALLVRHGQPVRTRDTRWMLWDRLAEWPIRELQSSVRAQLKVRPQWSVAD